MDNNEAIDRAINKSQELQELLDRQRELYKQLDQALALQKLWPDVFEHGAASSRWVGPHEEGFRFRNTPANAWRLQITNGLGETREFVREDVPSVLHRKPDQWANYFKS